MPELPEVETIRDALVRAKLLGKVIQQAQVFWPRTVSPLSAAHFCQQIFRQTIHQIARRGKNLVLTLTDHALIVHLRMTGKLFIKKRQTLPTAHERLRLSLDDGRFLCFEDQRKFGRFYLLRDPQQKLDQLGVEPLSAHFTARRLRELCHQKKVMAKRFLLDQRWVVGLGNIYVDEALWEAQIHPLFLMNQLTLPQLERLVDAIRLVLLQGIAHRGTTLGSHPSNYHTVNGQRGEHQEHLNVFRRKGEDCRRCQHKIIKIRVAQRGTYLCPFCQKL